jgi:hypothetical protein
MTSANPFDLCDHWNVYRGSVNTMATTMSNQPIASVVSATRFQWYLMRDIPFLPRNNFHFA